MYRRWIPVAMTLVVGCTNDSSSEIGTQSEGESCDETSDCVAGFDCVGSICSAIVSTGDRGFGAECISDGECNDGLLCGRQGPDGEPKEQNEIRVCTDVVPLPTGAVCALTVQCDFGLLCSGLGECVPEGSPNTAPEGASCPEFDSCRRPFVCGPSDTCERVPVFVGLDCTTSDREAGVFRSYFEVPALEPEEDIEFYRLPYPNDIRVRDGAIDLRGHANPGEVLGSDVADLYFNPIETDSKGFAVNQPVFFRFSDSVDPSTICLDEGGVYSEPDICAGGGPATVYLVNIDRDSVDYNQRQPLELVYDNNAGSYICQNSIGVAPLPGQSLRNGETYAVVLSDGLVDPVGNAPIQDRDFAAMLVSAPPNQPDRPELDLAHAAMAPLRAWIRDTGVDASSLVNASVFTTEDATAVGPKLRLAARSLPASFAGNSVVCDGAVAGPCAISGTTRGCPNAVSDDWFEIQGTYAGPVVQSGTRPYLTVDDGGEIVFDSSGNIQLQSPNETMCLGLALPRQGGAPLVSTTYPVVIYGHGTDGDYRSAFEDGTVSLLTHLGFAVLTFDNVMHGPRQGASDPSLWQDPGQLFFNPFNPRASRDNVLQGAADLFRLVHLAQSSAVNVDGANIRFSQIYYYGHSQGTVISPAFLAFESALTGVFQSGAGSELALSILNKREPAGLEQIVAASFGETSLERIHPMLGMLAHLFGPADAPAYASAILSEPVAAGRFPYFQIQGVDDAFTPDVTQHALIRALDIPFVGDVPRSVDGIDEVDSPLQGQTAAGAIQLLPQSGEDGHFVAFREPEARAAIERFFESVLAGRPEIAR